MVLGHTPLTGEPRLGAAALVGAVVNVGSVPCPPPSILARALTIYEKTLGPEHPNVAHSLKRIGAVYGSQGRYYKGLEYFRKALAIEEKALGPEHPDVAHSLNNMGLVYWKQGKYDLAHEYLGKALATWETVLGPEHPLLAWPLSGIGKVFVDQGRHHDALTPLERAVRICEKRTCEPEPHGRGLFALARALAATDGDNERAIRLATEARGVFGNTPKGFTRELEEVTAWLKEHGAE